MSNGSYTAGPWVASKTDRSIGPAIKDDDQSYGMILPVAWVEFDGKPGHHQANANLIAAAPELLEALQDAEKALFAALDNAFGEELANGNRELIQARAAIARALGQ